MKLVAARAAETRTAMATGDGTPGIAGPVTDQAARTVAVRSGKAAFMVAIRLGLDGFRWDASPTNLRGLPALGFRQVGVAAQPAPLASSQNESPPPPGDAGEGGDPGNEGD